MIFTNACLVIFGIGINAISAYIITRNMVIKNRIIVLNAPANNCYCRNFPQDRVMGAVAQGNLAPGAEKQFNKTGDSVAARFLASLGLLDNFLNLVTAIEITAIDQLVLVLDVVVETGLIKAKAIGDVAQRSAARAPMIE